MRRAIATVSLSGTLADKLKAAASAGFDAIELFEPDFVGYRGSAGDLRALANDLGLGIDLYQPLRDFEGMPEVAFRRNLDRAERKFDLMEALGAPMLLVCSNVSSDSVDDAGLAAAQLHALAELAARRGLRVGYEALAWGRWVQRYRQAWSIVERAAHPNLGLILDSFHTLSLGDDPSAIRQIPGERIYFVQMADAPLMPMDVLHWARHHRNFPGQGQFDCETFFEHIVAAGYTGTLSLEIFNDVFRATPNRRTALDGMRSLLFLESEVRGRLERAAASSSAPLTAAHTESLQLFRPPDRARLGGFGFLEFGVDEETARRLGAFLERFGFRRYGRHRTKAVTLFQQGDIKLVLNAEPGSDARAWFDVQGASVCCLGILADDPLRAADRASALLSARRDSPRGAQDLDLPAIVAPGGTIVQFVPENQSVEADFVRETLRPLPPDPTGATRIDHIAMGLAPDRFDTWVLFTRAVLGLRLGESVDLADPFGLIRTSAVADAERRIRLVLNVSLSPRTRTAQQVSAAGPSGGRVQHVALGCDDIFLAVERLRSHGARFVPISGNYYDDLAARTGLDAALISRMRALDILFDSAGEGTFLHAYAEPFEDQFFFEVVQRNGYDGYGVVNAPARMAAVEQQKT
jgi:4-hydroxyphenylpyruvate dioxygenase